jgi:transposase
MARKRTYSTQCVDRVVVEPLAPSLEAGCIVALDVAKEKFVGAIASSKGEVVKLFRFEHPKQTRTFLTMVSELQRIVGAAKVKVAMEPTGTYGDAIRYQLEKLGVPIWMVAPKKTHDSQALFDDVASLHDPKCAVQVAKLCAMDLASPWRAHAPTRVRLRALVELRGHELGHEERCFGRIEAMLARHWPELEDSLDIRAHKTSLALLARFPSPARVAAAPDEVRDLVRKASRGHLYGARVSELIDACTNTLGVPMVAEEEKMLSTLAAQAEVVRRRTDALEAEMKDVGSHDEVFEHLAPWMGTFTASAIVTLCDPRQYEHARQLEKACGLNLREKSSGRDNDFPEGIRLRVTKRGPSLVRKLLFLFALRMIGNDPTVHAWYVRRRRYVVGSKISAVVAVMRKLVRAVFHVARGSVYDARKLFDVRRLHAAEIALSTPANSPATAHATAV